MELRSRSVDAEICLVGGAILHLVFHRDPGTNRPAALFAPHHQLQAAIHVVTERLALPDDWLPDAVRTLLNPHGREGVPFHVGTALSVLRAPAEYVLAMCCLRLAVQPSDADRATALRDIGYLARFAGLGSPSDVVRALGPYLKERQRPADLEERLSEVL